MTDRSEPRRPHPDAHDLKAHDWADYALLDSGGGQKLERYGPYTVIRPEPLAEWSRTLARSEWDAAHAQYRPGEGWHFRQALPPRWTMTYQHLTFYAAPTPYKHLGVFPEQAAHWDWLADLIRAAARPPENPIRVLNLFGYTGLASLAAAAAGAHVTHVDSSKKAVAWARENQALSGLGEKPIRWIVEDVNKYTLREVRRGSRYDGLILDPPPFGHGPKGEVWEFSQSLPALLEVCRALLSESPLFAVITAYTARTSAAELRALLDLTLADCPACEGESQAGRLLIAPAADGRTIPTAFYTRWPADHAT